MNTLNKIVQDISLKKLDELNEYGYIKGGHNGPYYDTDTHVRNTAHFAIIFSYMYKETQDKKYYDAIVKCGNYVISKDAMPMNANFFCRYNTKKDFCNGTIGAAWAIEGLVECYKVTNDDQYIAVAQQVFERFPFDSARKAWKIINVDGSLRDFDRTFNHQLWFAIAGLQILSVVENSSIHKTCTSFINNLGNTFRTYNSGLVKHPLYLKGSKMDFIRNTALKANYTLKSLKTKKSMKYKENGYHLFNMYALAVIKDLGKNISLFETKSFEKALDYCFSDELYMWLENKSITNDINSMPNVKSSEINIYGYSYNGAGFELPYIYKVFKDNINKDSSFVEKIIEKQINYTYNEQEQSFSNNCEDANTLDARIYEYVRCLL